MVSSGSVPSSLDVYIHDAPLMFCPCVWSLVLSLFFVSYAFLLSLGIQCSPVFVRLCSCGRTGFLRCFPGFYWAWVSGFSEPYAP